MKKHTKTYLNHFGFSGYEFIPCEICGAKAVDIHHICARGRGGSKEKDSISNLMALCRSCHLQYGDRKDYVLFLIEKHKDYILTVVEGI